MHSQFQSPCGPPQGTLANPRHLGLRAHQGGRLLMQDRGCAAQDWRRQPLTEEHHPSDRGEAEGPKDFPRGGGA